MVSNKRKFVFMQNSYEIFKFRGCICTNVMFKVIDPKLYNLIRSLLIVLPFLMTSEIESALDFASFYTEALEVFDET